MRLVSRGYLFDVNFLIALTEDEHSHHGKAMEWFGSVPQLDWAICPLTEAGYVRVTTNQKGGFVTIAEATEALNRFSKLPGYHYWPITEKWVDLVAPFSERVLGHQQVTDAYLLGLAIDNDGILVTFDKAIRFLAGPKYAKNLLLLD